MRDILIIVFAFGLASLFSAGSCDPNNKDIFNTEVVRLKGQLSNNTDTININDTLIFTLTLPLTINGTTQNVTVNNVQEGFYYLKVQKFDTVTKRAKIILPADPEAVYFVNPGSQSNAAINLQTNIQPYTSKFHLIPKEGGLFYLEVVGQPGRLKVNGNYEARLIVNFDVINKHHEMMSRYLGNDWLNGIRQLDTEGFGFYVFAVK